MVEDSFTRSTSSVMPGLVPGIHVLLSDEAKTWMAGTSPAMTTEFNCSTFTTYRFLPSIGVIFNFASSIPSMQLTFSATTSVPSGLLPRANTSTPQSMQS
jgi:hypothetical protein